MFPAEHDDCISQALPFSLLEHTSRSKEYNRHETLVASPGGPSDEAPEAQFERVLNSERHHMLNTCQTSFENDVLLSNRKDVLLRVQTQFECVQKQFRERTPQIVYTTCSNCVCNIFESPSDLMIVSSSVQSVFGTCSRCDAMLCSKCAQTASGGELLGVLDWTPKSQQ